MTILPSGSVPDAAGAAGPPHSRREQAESWCLPCPLPGVCWWPSRAAATPTSVVGSGKEVQWERSPGGACRGVVVTVATDQNSFAKAVLDPNADRAPLLIGFQETGPCSSGLSTSSSGSHCWLCSRLRSAVRACSLDGAMTPMVNQLAWAIA